ncbi:RsiV family protein [Pelistega europaea]|uniref:DUF3298 domain-containing protein n=1 Tax=Pelistega europaea TaxID=106147 RepID=A0A7Y4L8R9_9BURK|nr:RsiV family protein [Pelistega europaea]NOL48999.1 DUF3298 domain-containing protein [Pelistega europaea]
MKKKLVLVLMTAFALAACNDDTSKKLSDAENKVSQLEANIAAKDENLKQLQQSYDELKTQYDTLKADTDKQDFPGLRVEAKSLFDKTGTIQIKEDGSSETRNIDYGVTATTLVTRYDWLNQILLKAVLAAADDSGTSKKLPDNVTEEDVEQAYAAIFNQFKEGAPESKPISLQKTTEVRYVGQKESLLTFNLQTYLFEGGAHGMMSTHYINIDADKKTIISLNNLVQKGNLNKVRDVLWEAYQQRSNMLGTEPTVKKKDFKVSNNFYFTADGIVFVYPVYELASYAEGEVELLASYYQINQFLAKDYQQTAKDGFKEAK